MSLNILYTTIPLTYVGTYVSYSKQALTDIDLFVELSLFITPQM